MSETNLKKFVDENKTSATEGYSHSLDILYAIIHEMDKQSIDHPELAKRMGISLDDLFDTMSNFNEKNTLVDIAAFEIALGVELVKIPAYRESE